MPRRPAFIFLFLVSFLASGILAVAAEVNSASLDSSIKRGVDFLITHQNSNGSWGSAANTKNLNIYAPLPGAHQAFRAGASGLALSGLIDAADPTRKPPLPSLAPPHGPPPSCRNSAAPTSPPPTMSGATLTDCGP